MPDIELPSGKISYEDTGGDGPVVVLLHGVLMTGTLWDRCVPALSDQYRCITPTLPLGSHAHQAAPNADLSLSGVAGILGDFLAALGLSHVTVVGSDTGGALAQLLVAQDSSRVARMVLISCEAFDNFPPGLPGKVSAIAGKTPGGLWLAAQQLRIGAMQRLPITYGWMTKRPIPKNVLNSWMESARRHSSIRRDFRRFLTSGDPRSELTAAGNKLAHFTGPALVIWAAEDRLMPAEHGKRMANLLPNGNYTEIADTYTLIPLDQPETLVDTLLDFLDSTATESP